MTAQNARPCLRSSIARIQTYSNMRRGVPPIICLRTADAWAMIDTSARHLCLVRSSGCARCLSMRNTKRQNLFRCKTGTKGEARRAPLRACEITGDSLVREVKSWCFIFISTRTNGAREVRKIKACRRAFRGNARPIKSRKKISVRVGTVENKRGAVLARLVGNAKILRLLFCRGRRRFGAARPGAIEKLRLEDRANEQTLVERGADAGG